MVKLVTGLFETRRAAEIAVERMVQEHGLDRARIQAYADGAENSSGTVVSGADADDVRRGKTVEGQRAGAIRVAAQVEDQEVETVLKAFRDAGATESATREASGAAPGSVGDPAAQY